MDLKERGDPIKVRWLLNLPVVIALMKKLLIARLGPLQCTITKRRKKAEELYLKRESLINLQYYKITKISESNRISKLVNFSACLET